MTSLQAYVARLKELVALVEAGDFSTINTFFGVCYAIENSNIDIDTIETITDHTIATWEHFSGDLKYPIPVTCSRYLNPKRQFNYTDNLWSGKQLTMRISYMKHLIKELS